VEKATGAAKPRGAGAGRVGTRSRRDNQRGETGNESERRKVDGGGSVGPRTLEVETDVSIVEDGEAVIGQWWAEDVAAQALAAILVVGGDASGSL
jgi:hypothetical protein